MITTPTKPLTEFDHARIVQAAVDAGFTVYDRSEFEAFKSWAWVGIDRDGELIHNHRPEDFGPDTEATYSLNRLLSVIRSARKPGAARCVMRAPVCDPRPGVV